MERSLPKMVTEVQSVLLNEFAWKYSYGNDSLMKRLERLLQYFDPRLRVA